jgi:large subunit ribosomal protein L10
VRVVKNSFLKRAMADSGMPDVGDKLTGQTAIVMGQNDVAPVAKILKAFAAEFKIAALKIGVIDKAVMSTSDVEALAELPAREILLAQLLGLFQAPATRLVRVLNEPAAAFARLLKAKGDKDEAAAPAEAKKEEAPAAAATETAPAAEAEPAAEAPGEAKKEEAPATPATETAPAAEAAPSAEATPATEAAPATESTTGEKPAGETAG